MKKRLMALFLTLPDPSSFRRRTFPFEKGGMRGIDIIQEVKSLPCALEIYFEDAHL